MRRARVPWARSVNTSCRTVFSCTDPFLRSYPGLILVVVTLYCQPPPRPYATSRRHSSMPLRINLPFGRLDLPAPHPASSGVPVRMPVHGQGGTGEETGLLPESLSISRVVGRSI